MTDLPPGWASATLENVLAVERRPITDGPFGSKLASRHYAAAGARVIRLQNIGDGVFRDEEAFISMDYFQELRDHEVRVGDLLIASLGEELPRACIAPDLGTPAIVKADCIRARIHPHIDIRWVLYALLAPPTREWTTPRIKGVGRPRLGMAGIRKIPLPVPPLAEQRRIVAALEDHLAHLDFATNSVQSAQSKKKRLPGRLIDAQLDTLGAETSPLLSVLREPLINGRSVPTDSSGFPVLRLTALHSGRLALSERKGGRWTSVDAAPFLVRKGDFFISRGNGSLSLVGRGSLLEDDPDPVAFPDTMIRIRVNEQIMSPEFLRLVWGSRRVRTSIERFARTTAGIYKVNQRMIEAIRVPVPDLHIQEQVVAEVREAMSGVDHVSEQIQQALIYSERLRRSLLADAFAGRLVEQDPADEPASVLLERIRAERGEQTLPRRIRRGIAEIAPQKETLL
jgi:type I restriction enzyme, S subunit